jgi:hypothetical protein
MIRPHGSGDASRQSNSGLNITGNETGRAWCDWCGDTFPNKEGLQDHQQLTTRSRDDRRNAHDFSYNGARICVPKEAVSQQPGSAISPTLKRSASVTGLYKEEGAMDDDWEASHDTDSLSDTTSTVVRSEEDPNGDNPGLRQEPDREPDAPEPESDDQATNELYSTSIPRSSFMTSDNFRNGAKFSLSSFRRDQLSLASPRSFGTAQSSLASYATASSVLGSKTESSRFRYLSHLSSRQPDTDGQVRALGEVPGEVFSSEWIRHLHLRGILLDSKDELDWSGRGQHVEYELEDADKIPLIPEKILGHSASALVESVRCRRIRLARKKIRCHRRLKKEDVIVEVEHLQRLQHAHIIRVVGTYTLKKDLAILLYPATQWNLDEFMDDTPEESTSISMTGGSQVENHTLPPLYQFFGCLSDALSFIHKQHIKHMDIKPQNVLVRQLGARSYKVYIADFGIARAYTSPAESETDSPIAYTRTYAAPEVVHQDKRDFSADIFSLGCVFMEMMATLLEKREELQEIRKCNTTDTSYQANLHEVCTWYWETVETGIDAKWGRGFSRRWPLVDHIPVMMNEVRRHRPSADGLKAITADMRCPTCHHGPEPFENAEFEYAVW